MNTHVVWNFQKPEKNELLKKSQDIEIKEFFYSLLDSKNSNLESKSLVNQIKEQFNFNESEMVEFLVSKIPSDLTSVFSLMANNVFLSEENLTNIDNILEKYSTLTINEENLKDQKDFNGVSINFSTFLRGLFELNTTYSYNFIYKYILNINSCTMPIISGNIKEHSETKYKNYELYKEVLVFTSIIHSITKVMCNGFISNNSFSIPYYYEMGNTLLKATDILFPKNNFKFNLSRIILRRREVSDLHEFRLNTITNNPEYTLYREPLILQTNYSQKINEEAEYKKVYERLIEELFLFHLTYNGVSFNSSVHHLKSLSVLIFRDYHFIKELIPKYNADFYENIRALVCDSLYLSLRFILDWYSLSDKNFNDLEIIHDQINSFLELETSHNSSQYYKYIHVIESFKIKLHTQHVWDLNSTLVKLNLNDLIEKFKLASSVGSLSAKHHLASSYINSNRDNQRYFDKAMVIAKEYIELKAPLLLFASNFDPFDAYADKYKLNGISTQLFTDYFHELVEGWDLTVLPLNGYYLNHIETSIEFENEEDENDINSLRYALERMPYLRNSFCYQTDFDALEAMLLVSYQLGSSLAFITLNKYMITSENKSLGLDFVTLDDLNNPSKDEMFLSTQFWLKCPPDMYKLRAMVGGISIFLAQAKNLITVFDSYLEQLENKVADGVKPSLVDSGKVVNFYLYILQVCHFILLIENACPKVEYKETADLLFRWLKNHSSVDVVSFGLVKLSDLIQNKNANFLELIEHLSALQKTVNDTNVLTNKTLLIPLLVSTLTHVLPRKGTVFNFCLIQFLAYMARSYRAIWINKNYLMSDETRIYNDFLTSVFLQWIIAESSVNHSQITSTSMRNGQHPKLNKAAMNQHKVMVANLQKQLDVILPKDLVHADFQHLIQRGYPDACFQYIKTINLIKNIKDSINPGPEILMHLAQVLVENDALTFINTKKKNQISFFLFYNAVLPGESPEGYLYSRQARHYFLTRSIEYGNILALAYDAQTGLQTPERITITGKTYEDSIAHLKLIGNADRQVCHVLETLQKNKQNPDLKESVSLKFMKAKLKLNLQDITIDQWIALAESEIHSLSL